MAYFTDVETVGTNTLQAGTVDIIIGEDYVIEFLDMKPSYTEYYTFVIENPEDNPVNVWKHLYGYAFDGGDLTEPEEEEGSGTGNYVEDCNIDRTIRYDLHVFVPIGTEGHGWWQTIYYENIFLDELDCQDIYLGMIPAFGTMEVTQSYHMDKDTTNWAQGDIMTFHIEVKAEQLTGFIRLENKKEAGGNWELLGLTDGIYGDLTYNVRGPNFDYEFKGYGLSDIEYCLIYYADPWPGSNPGYMIGKGTASGGSLTLTDSVNLGMDLPDSNDLNHPEGAKIWLVPSSDYDESTVSMKVWNPSDYLFETGLIVYDDTG